MAAVYKLSSRASDSEWATRPPWRRRRFGASAVAFAEAETERAGSLPRRSSKSEGGKRRARERVGESRLRLGYGGHRRSFSVGVPRGEAPRIRTNRSHSR